MDECTSKRSVGGLGVAKRGSILSLRDSNHEGRHVRYCNRIGCSASLSSMKGTQISNQEKAKYSRPTFRSASGKTTVGSSSKSFTGSSDLRKTRQEQQNSSSLKGKVPAESNREPGETEVSELVPLTEEVRAEHPEIEVTGSAVIQNFSVNTAGVGSYNATSNLGVRKQVHQQSALGSKDISLGSSVRRSFLSRNNAQAAKSVSQDSGHARKADATKRRYTDGESSSSRTTGMNRSSSGGNSSCQRKTALSSASLSFSEASTSQRASRKMRNWSEGNSSGSSVRTRTFSVGTRTRVSDNGSYSSLTEPVMVPPLPQTNILVSESTPVSSSVSFPTEFRSIYQNSYGQSDSSNEMMHSRPISPPEDGSTRVSQGLSVDRDGYRRRINMDGIAEMLLALERIEQDEELTYEQLLVLETNLLLGGLTFNDQHRDMRLDIDNMSYEELLALEERMGTVSTALTEEALSKCVTRSIYTPTILPELAGCGDDIKCSVCQEEYATGDEVGKLGCEHRYHVECIHQWLRLKNWCPVCKASALVS